jgi:hypothetical protein
MKSSSKIVKFKRLLPFVHEAQDEQSRWMNEQSLSIGSSFDGNRPNYGGLSYEELNYIMPELVDAEPTDRDFRKKVTDYFHSISLKVKPKGTPLEIGLLDNDKPLLREEEVDGTKKVIFNPPLNIEEYVKYRACSTHPWTAKSLSEGKSNPLKYVYIENKEQEVAQRKKENETKDKAQALYSQDKKDLTKIDQILSVLHTGYFTMDDEDKMAELRNIAVGKPEAYIATSQDESLKYRFFIKRLNIITQEGSYFIYDGQQIGVNIGSAIQFLKDKGNSEVMVALKARLDTFKK